MAAVVADTHSVLWSLLQPKKLSANALATFNQATLLGDPVYVASISVDGKIKAAGIKTIW